MSTMTACVHGSNRTRNDCPVCTPRLPFFVYGTLRPNCGNTWAWDELAKPIHDGEAIILGYRLVGQGFPYAIPAASAQTVGTLIVPHPDLYDRVLDNFDGLEGEGRLYRRIQVAVMCPNDIVSAWMYEPIRVENLWSAPEVGQINGRFDWHARSRYHITKEES